MSFMPTIVLLLLLIYLPFRYLRRLAPGAFRLGGWALKLAVGLARVILWVLPSATLRALGARLGDTTKVVRCISGCKRKLPAVAVVTCRSCGYRTRRNLYAPCACCGSTRRHVRCPHCRMSIPRRALWTQPQPPRAYR